MPKGKKTVSMKKKTLQLVSIPVFILIGFLFSYFASFYYEYHAKNYVNPELSGMITEEVMQATILLINEIREENSIAYGVGSSGVIFMKEGNTCYFLTARHALEFVDRGQVFYRVLGYGDLTFQEYFEQTGKWPLGGITGYYSRYPLARLEYTDEVYDLAILSFVSEGPFSALPLYSGDLKTGEPVVSIGNPEGIRNRISYGKIRNLSPVHFKDASGPVQYPMIRHTAYVSRGSSGGPVLNASAEIVGISLAGGENVFRFFRHGLMMPADRVRQFLSDWEDNR